MPKINFEEYRRNRTEELMHQFFVYESECRDMVTAGGKFIDVHECQIQAANVINDVREEGLLSLAEEMYSWEKETIREFLKIYDEIKSGVRI